LVHAASAELTGDLGDSNPIRICPWDGDVADMLVGRIRDNSTTKLSPVGMMKRDTLCIPRG
jgi:hypothetical protein